MHPTFFHFDSIEIILFKEWHIMNWQGMVGSAVAITLLAALYEILKYYREKLYSKRTKNPETVYSLSNISNICSKTHVIQTILVTIQVFLSNILMLISMTYNVYLCMALIVGASLAYFLLFWKCSYKSAIRKIQKQSVEPIEFIELSISV